MGRREVKWIFETCTATQLPRCAAFRASVYFWRASRCDGVAERCDHLLLPNGCRNHYPFWIRPFVVLCLFVAVKIETRDWDLGPFRDVAVEFVRSMRLVSDHPIRDLQSLEFELAQSLEWKLLPTSPFLVLEEMNTEHAFAAQLIEEALLIGLDGVANAEVDAEVVATAALVAAHACESPTPAVERCVRAMVECVAQHTPARTQLVGAFAEKLEALHRKRSASTASPRFAKRARLAESPSSVMHAAEQ